MKLYSPRLIVVALILFCAPAVSRAELIPWMYNWSRSPNEIKADAPGTGSIALTDEPLKAAVGDSDIVATNMRTFSTATRDNPDRFTARPFALTLFLVDVESGQSGTLTFQGQIDGTLTATSANLIPQFTGPTVQTLLLGRHSYRASIGSISPPGIPGSANAGSINSRTQVTIETVVTLPEPGTLVLSGVGLLCLGVARWRKRRRWRPRTRPGIASGRRRINPE